jgi:hypothetical protein
LFQRLKETLGEDEANTLMEHLPPVGWADVATKRDLEHQDALVQAQFVAMRKDMEVLSDRFEAEFVAIRRDMAVLSDRFEAEFVAIRRDIEHMGDKLRAEFHKELRSQFIALLAANATMVGLAVGLAQALH